MKKNGYLIERAKFIQELKNLDERFISEYEEEKKDSVEKVLEFMFQLDVSPEDMIFAFAKGEKIEYERQQREIRRLMIKRGA